MDKSDSTVAERIARMEKSNPTVAEQVARAAGAFEDRRTKRGRDWVAVFLNEDTIAIALHGSLTVAEKLLSQSLAGAAQVQEFHRKLFINDAASLLREINKITGMEVRDVTAEINPSAGSVVQIFATDTVVEEFLQEPGGLAGAQCAQPARW
jgi:uncharacterized protein YbcI